MRTSTSAKASFIFLFIATLHFHSQAVIHIIRAEHKQFVPAKLQAYTGDTIQWVWQSGKYRIKSTHIPDGALPFTANMNSKSRIFQLVLSVPGSYDYVSSVKNIRGNIAVDNAPITAAVNSDTIKIYPQPFKNSLTIDVGNSNIFKGPVTIEIFDALGQSKYRKSSETVLLNPLTLNLPDWPAGYYFLNLSDGQQKRTYRLVKQE